MDFIAEYLGFLSSPAGWAALVTLVTMEIVLGIDNLIFISILTNKLPAAQQSRARRIGIGAALVLRLALLFTISIIVQLTEPVFTAFGHGFRGATLFWLPVASSLSGRRPRKSITRLTRMTARKYRRQGG